MAGEQPSDRPGMSLRATAPPTGLETDIGDHAEELPGDLEADFMPLETAAGEADRTADLDPYLYDSLQAQEAFDYAVEIAASGDEERAVQEFIRASKIAETAREWHLAAVACQRVGDFLLQPPPPCDLDRAFRMYRRAVAAYEQSGLFVEARDLAYRLMYYRMRHAGALKLSLARQAELRIYWLTSGFGYRPARVVGTAIVLVLVFGLIYWLANGIQVSHGAARLDLWHAIYFSGITFATVGYGDLVPKPGVQFVALLESFMGVFMLGLFVAVLANRLNRT